jgi:hypothetical protein
LTTKYWRTNGVRLTVAFLDNPPAALRTRILSHMNAWAESANVKFVPSATDPQVRIARTAGDGYWSYLGTDILSIKPNDATMNLDAFTMQTPDSRCSAHHTPTPNSIICYQIPGTITKTGKPILGGVDIDKSDYAFPAKIYPNPRRAPVTRSRDKASGRGKKLSGKP